MILRSGNAASFLIEFPSGPPDGNVTWNLLGPDGATLASGTVTPAEDAVSAFINIDSEDNTLDSTEMSSFRDLVYSYAVNGQIVNDERRYTIEGRVPFGVSNDGVRSKLGVERHNLPDSEISLVKAYYDFASLVGDQFADTALTGPEQFRVREAIEALAALALIPTMQVRIAEKEASGTDSFQRQEIDWAAIATSLDALVRTGIEIIIPGFDPIAGFGSLFILAGPSSDAFTAAEGAQG